MAITSIKFTPVSEQEPPSPTPRGSVMIAISPDGMMIETDWRPSYGIFTCQNKTDSSYGWKWAVITDSGDEDMEAYR